MKKISVCKRNKTKTALLLSLIIVLIITFFLLTLFEIRFSDELDNVKAQQVSTHSQKNELIEEHIETIDNLSNKITIIKTVNSFIVVMVSMGISGLLTSLVLDKKNIDDIYTEMFEKIKKESEVNIYFDKNSLYDVTSNVLCDKKKLPLPTDIVKYMIKKVVGTTGAGYYYKNYSVSVDCQIKEENVLKEIKKTYDIEPFDKTHRFISTSKSNRLLIITQTCLSGTGNNIKIQQITLNNKPLDLNNDITCSSEKIRDEELPAKQGYREKYYYYYNKDIETSKSHPIKLSVTYSTTVSKDDLSYVIRVPRPCKKFNLSYTVNENSNYRPYGNAFGFFDDASKTLNTSNKKKLDFSFDDWIFPLDGVCIEMRKEE